MSSKEEQRPGTPPPPATEEHLSPTPPRWRFGNSTKKASGYSSEWNVATKDENGQGVNSIDNDGIDYHETAKREQAAANEVQVIEKMDVSESTEAKEADTKISASSNKGKEDESSSAVELRSGWSGISSGKMVQVSSQDDQDDASKDLDEENGDSSSFDTAQDETSTQQGSKSGKVYSTQGGWRGVITETHKSFDELQTRDEECLEDPTLLMKLPDEVKGMMQSLGSLVYGGNDRKEEDEGEGNEEIMCKVETPKQETDDTTRAEIKTSEVENNTMDHDVENQDLLHEVNIATEETVEENATNDDEAQLTKDSAKPSSTEVQGDDVLPINNKRKKLLLLGLLTIMVVVAVVLGVLLAGKKESTDDGTCSAVGEECAPNNCQAWTCGDHDCCCCDGLTCIIEGSGMGFDQPTCG